VQELLSLPVCSSASKPGLPIASKVSVPSSDSSLGPCQMACGAGCELLQGDLQWGWWERASLCIGWVYVCSECQPARREDNGSVKLKQHPAAALPPLCCILATASVVAASLTPTRPIATCNKSAAVFNSSSDAITHNRAVSTASWKEGGAATSPMQWSTAGILNNTVLQLAVFRYIAQLGDFFSTISRSTRCIMLMTAKTGSVSPASPAQPLHNRSSTKRSMSYNTDITRHLKPVTHTATTQPGFLNDFMQSVSPRPSPKAHNSAPTYPKPTRKANLIY